MRQPPRRARMPAQIHAWDWKQYSACVNLTRPGALLIAIFDPGSPASPFLACWGVGPGSQAILVLDCWGVLLPLRSPSRYYLRVAGITGGLGSPVLMLIRNALRSEYANL